MMQVKIGNGGSNPVGVRFGGGGAIRSAVQSMASPENWIYDIIIVVFVAIVIVLAVLIVREFYLQRKKKKQP
jgi:hypothetical protein